MLPPKTCGGICGDRQGAPRAAPRGCSTTCSGRAGARSTLIRTSSPDGGTPPSWSRRCVPMAAETSGSWPGCWISRMRRWDPRGLRQPVWHCVARGAPGDRLLSDHEWAELARDIMHRTGLASHGQDDDAVRWIAVRHAADHVHIVGTLARQDGARAPILERPLSRPGRWRSVRANGDTKTEKSRRTLELPGQAADALREHRARQAEERLAAGPLWRDHGLVFASQAGTPLDASHVRRAFKAITRKAGLGENWTPRELRHSFVSIMSDNGVPIESHR